jgi:methylmalonyl-CoA mutase N-terminal domain/subunit
VLGGTQSLHTNSLDETYALPTEDAVTIALRTQQIIAEESGVAGTIDPLGGSYYVENMTQRLEDEAEEIIRRIDEMGGMVRAIEKGYPQREIAASSYRFQRQLEAGERIMVAVNKHADEKEQSIPVLRVDAAVAKTQIANLHAVKASRDTGQVRTCLEAVRVAALTKPGTDASNLMPPIVDAAKAYCTQQEICDVLRETLGTYSDPAEF